MPQWSLESPRTESLILAGDKETGPRWHLRHFAGTLQTPSWMSTACMAVDDEDNGLDHSVQRESVQKV